MYPTFATRARLYCEACIPLDSEDPCAILFLLIMQAYHLNNSVLTVSPPGSNFQPRKEFVRDIQRTTSTHAILSIAGTGYVRLCSFPPPVSESLKTLFHRYHDLLRYRLPRAVKRSAVNVQSRWLATLRN